MQRNIEARSCNHCCSGKAIHVTYPESVFVAAGIQHAICKPHISICGLSCSTIFSTLAQNRHNEKKKRVIEDKMRVLISSTNLYDTFLILIHSKKN